jgi:hypothetical protein
VALVAAVLLPNAPRPVIATQRPVPRFILSGEWRQYVDARHTMVPVPVPRNDHMEGMRWAALTNIAFALPRGYFMGPRSLTDNRANWDPPARPTSSLLAMVAWKGVIPPITDTNRAAARVDLRYWKAAVLVLPPTEAHADQLREAVNELVGPGTWDAAGGVWLWDVRGVTG